MDMIQLAIADTVCTRLIVLGVAIAFGAFMIVVGKHNIQSKTAEESGRRRAVNELLGRSNTTRVPRPLR